MSYMVEHPQYPGVFYDPGLVYIHTGDAAEDAAHRLMMAERTYCIPQTVIIGAFTVSADSANP